MPTHIAGKFMCCPVLTHSLQALAEHEYFLHPYLDSIHSLLSPHTSPDDIVSKLSLSNHVDEHIDIGLFNIVLGRPQDLAALKLRLGPGAPKMRLMYITRQSSGAMICFATNMQDVFPVLAHQ